VWLLRVYLLTPEMIKDIVEKHPYKLKCTNLDDMYREVINFIKKIQSKYEFYKYFKETQQRDSNNLNSTS
jgi:hypothetical protein